MKTMSLISIYCGGALSLFMGIFHTRFYKLFKWEKEYERVTAANRRIFYTIHVALLLLFFGMAALSLLYARELSLGAGISFGVDLLCAAFWLWRAVWQALYFKPEKSSRLLILHHALTGCFFLLFIAYALPVVMQACRG
jgi:hypothetical protein